MTVGTSKYDTGWTQHHTPDTARQQSLHNCCFVGVITGVFNSVKQSRNSKPSVNVRHDREIPLLLYLGLKIYAVMRSKSLVDTLFHLGLCISYDCVLQIQSDIANGICQRYEIEKIVCPPNMVAVCLTLQQWTTLTTTLAKQQQRIF